MFFNKARIVKTTAWKNPTTTTQVADGDTSWSNTGNVLASDNAYATVATSPVNDSTNLLKAQGFDFAEVIGQIVGVEIQVEWKTSANSTSGRIYILDAAGGEASFKSGTLPTVEAYESFGGSTDRWSQALTDAWIKDADFGVGVRGTGTSGPSVTISVDHIQMRVTYVP